jgi:adenylate cyclase
MGDIARRLANLGVTEGQPPAEVRRIKTINLIACFAISFNALYTLLFAYIDISELWLVISTNSISIAGLAFVVAINARGRTNAAMWLLIAVALFNLGFAGTLLGLGTGVFLFLIAMSATGVLVTSANAWRTQLIVIAAGMVAVISIVLADPSTPEPIAGTAIETVLLVFSVSGTLLTVAVVGLYVRRVADTAESELRLATERSEALLLNILPQAIADRLKAGEEVIADRVEGVTILFADLVGFTPMSERLAPDEMVRLLNQIFTRFDYLADELRLEKIKTVGDAYMVAAGLPTARPDHVEAVADMALAMREELGRQSLQGGFGPLQMRYGIHTGAVVAGVIGRRKFSYDLWGDTVNTAARMESQGVPGEIQVTEDVYRRLRKRYRLDLRGTMEIKGKGATKTYFLEARI